MLKIGDNFDYRGRQPNFKRDQFETISEMVAIPESQIDDGHISYCLETKKRYIYSHTRFTEHPTLGYWRELVDTILDADPETENLLLKKINEKIWTGTQEQYDALETKDPNNLYIIYGNPIS